ncbi:hypothetical protein KFK09_005450 [Dendrobium nobile]|uniref:F-box domain-containing protein n=1 Tax=Dendrobium nobile TaxID=94219 RepID=A0A8T3BVP2_DENNO|nr:hypothetical protein KFK09_005450 [Dendrobium nobile]
MKISFSKMNNSNISYHTETNGIGLTDDLLIEILTKLPLKCIYRYKCVSRSWRRLIADRYVGARLPLILSGVFYRSGPEDLKLEPRYGCNSNEAFPLHFMSAILPQKHGLLYPSQGVKASSQY